MIHVDTMIQFDHIKLCQTLRMTGTEPHAPRGTAGEGEV
jgi:hypothetical protein